MIVYIGMLLIFVIDMIDVRILFCVDVGVEFYFFFVDKF